MEIANAVFASFYGKVFFTCDGAEAVEHAIKMARWFTGRHKIVARYRSYHGATHAAMSLGADARGRNTPDGLTGVARVLPPYCYRCPFGLAYGSCGIRCADHVEDVIQFEGPDTVAAVIAEPAAGTNGIAPPPEYWQRLREICDRYGILLIADEVMSGFGRTGAWFAWQRLGEFTAAPDLFVMAKGLTGAHIPLGAICVSAKVASHFDNHLLETGLTYSGHPLACAAGVAAIQAYQDEGLIARSRALGDWMLQRLRAMQARHPVQSATCVDWACSPSSNSRRRSGMSRRAAARLKPPFPTPLPRLKRMSRDAREQGVSLATRGNLLILCPPLVIESADLEWGLSVIDHLLDVYTC